MLGTLHALRCSLAGAMAGCLARLVPAAAGAWLLLPAVAQAICLPVADLPLPQRYAALEGPAPLPLPAGTRLAQAQGGVRITFVGHASFLIESPAGVRAVTDYNGVHRPPGMPDIVTMNNAHSTHHTDRLDRGIRHVLRGWSIEPGKPSLHDVTEQDVRVRNIPTNVRDWSGDTRYAGNSIFVFEVAGLCIAHLGHLHHDLTEEHLAALGQIDVLMVPVDGGFTMAQEFMLEVIRQIRPAVVMPMHYFSRDRLQRFLDMVGEEFPARVLDTPTIVLSRQTLPWKQTIVLPGPH
ncbi:MBL fold metallo-hydrolase [Arenibaculum pallidiluteum]|uniref:MBL fold metallo-hydrolase n=1 Tax=Arenibaculum pallidiluteum TaxID=2812559 RepID=UPI001A9739B2|nr:MBL fold metallo-hydrolase [Arenibaculum pallidiluteum]